MIATGIPTNITVRVIAKGGKFLGADIGGAYITIANAQTGELLAHGNTAGGSGQPDLMNISINRQQTLPVIGASAFNATFLLAEPVLLKVTATGPGAGLQSVNTVSATQWMIPGKHITGGDGLMLELPGLLVQVQSPATHMNVPTPAPQTIDFTANVTMMCGCPITNTGPWPSADFEVGAIISVINPDGTVNILETLPLNFTGTTSQFMNSWEVPSTGFYQAVVYAYQAGTGNSGMGKVSFFMNPPSLTD